MSTWTKVAKPTGSTWTNIPKPTLISTLTGGEPIGLLLALTYTTINLASEWTNVSKPANALWTNIPKPTS